MGDGAGLWEEEEWALRPPHFGPSMLLAQFGCKVDQ